MDAISPVDADFIFVGRQAPVNVAQKRQCYIVTPIEDIFPSFGAVSVPGSTERSSRMSVPIPLIEDSLELSLPPCPQRPLLQLTAPPRPPLQLTAPTRPPLLQLTAPPRPPLQLTAPPRPPLPPLQLPQQIRHTGNNEESSVNSSDESSDERSDASSDDSSDDSIVDSDEDDNSADNDSTDDEENDSVNEADWIIEEKSLRW